MNSPTTWTRRAGLALGAVGAVWVGLSGCYPGDAPVSDVVATVHDPQTNFRSYQTFFLPNRVADFGDPSDPGYIEIDHSNDAAVLGRIRSNLVSLGWTEQTDSTQATVVVTVAALVAQNVDIWAYPPYWGGWWGWYPGYPSGGWGWGYPCCTTVTTYTTGTLFIDMVDPPPVTGPPPDTVPVIWAARANGLVNKSNTSVSRINAAIDQAFSQSSYLDID